jgi:hypothetical protein
VSYNKVIYPGINKLLKRKKSGKKNTYVDDKSDTSGSTNACKLWKNFELIDQY